MYTHLYTSSLVLCIRDICYRPEYNWLDININDLILYWLVSSSVVLVSNFNFSFGFSILPKLLLDLVYQILLMDCTFSFGIGVVQLTFYLKCIAIANYLKKTAFSTSLKLH